MPQFNTTVVAARGEQIRPLRMPVDTVAVLFVSALLTMQQAQSSAVLVALILVVAENVYGVVSTGRGNQVIELGPLDTKYSPSVIAGDG